MFKEVLISGAIVLLGGYRYYIHKLEDIECVSYEVKNSKIPKVFDNFKIVQISDLHNRSFGVDNNILLEKIDTLNPDIVCITGDLIDGANEDFSIALNLIDVLSRKYQVYHIIGNHEQKVMMNKYKVDQQVLKRKIEQTRTVNYEREHEIIDTIKKTEIKIHENVQKNIASTKPRKQNFTTFLLDSPDRKRRTVNYSEM
ncbi:metallophosphoesterase [Romboutsia ilealis]|uniref:metallophosphoesterase n=1 Tax=Romboutsia ilealis TaxID=1115758 RepID=UPI00259CE6B1|nr:metallophosphoesterase [Romboutsia ilealis]